MKFRFANKKLETLYIRSQGASKYPPEVVDAFIEVMRTLTAITDERELYEVKSLHFEKLKGNRAGQHSIRLNRQWRLLIAIEKDQNGKLLLIINIENHYGD